jgi:hypothetical protein
MRLLHRQDVLLSTASILPKADDDLHAYAMLGHGHAARSPYGGHATWPSPENAQEILDRRDASGEIAREEYDRLKQTLEIEGDSR